MPEKCCVIFDFTLTAWYADGSKPDLGRLRLQCLARGERGSGVMAGGHGVEKQASIALALPQSAVATPEIKVFVARSSLIAVYFVATSGS